MRRRNPDTTIGWGQPPTQGLRLQYSCTKYLQYELRRCDTGRVATRAHHPENKVLMEAHSPISCRRKPKPYLPAHPPSSAAAAATGARGASPFCHRGWPRVRSAVSRVSLRAAVRPRARAGASGSPAPALGAHRPAGAGPCCARTSIVYAPVGGVTPNREAVYASALLIVQLHCSALVLPLGAPAEHCQRVPPS